jgi:hypothetical protein
MRALTNNAFFAPGFVTIVRRTMISTSKVHSWKRQPRSPNPQKNYNAIEKIWQDATNR